MTLAADPEVAAAVATLAGATSPWLIGVRHHSAALARVMPTLLTAMKPRRIAIELPSDLEHWLPWLGHRGTQAPVALASAAPDGATLAFMPFADFSPELVAVRWALAHGVPVHAIDLPSDRRAAVPRQEEAHAGPGVADLAAARLGVDDQVRLWDRLVEDAALGQDAEAVRRAALAIGWSWRHGVPVEPRDLVRETWMRARLRELGSTGTVAVVGSFHAAALCPALAVDHDVALPEAGPAAVTALIPYSFAHFDDRSGYPAGVRDPAWHQAALGCADAATRKILLSDLIVAICRQLRSGGHQASPADAIALAALAEGLARLRGLPAPGRGELVEAVDSVLVRGEVLGGGRAVARALEQVLVGHALGTLPDGCPRAGLAVHLEQLLETLGLPGPRDAEAEPRELRLEPWRSDLDRLRVVLLERLRFLNIPYGEREVGEGGAGGDEALGESWSVRWTHLTAANVMVAAVHGATVDQAVSGLMQQQWARQQEVQPHHVLEALAVAARCGVADRVGALLAHLGEAAFLASADLSALVTALDLVHRLRLGQAVGLPATMIERSGMRLTAFTPPDQAVEVVLAQAAERLVEGLHGSERLADVEALVALANWQAQAGEPPGTRLVALFRRMLVSGSTLMQGAAHGLLFVAEASTAADFAGAPASWCDRAVDADGRRALRQRFSGLLVSAAPLLIASPELLDPLHATIASLDDQAFFDRLPALRGGSEVIPPEQRQLLLESLLQRHAPSASRALVSDPRRLALQAQADVAGWAAVQALLPGWVAAATTVATPSTEIGASAVSVGAIGMADRWRLILGEPPTQSPALASLAGLSVESCYGSGARGSRRRLGGEGHPAAGGGSGAPRPTAREWGENLDALFSSDVREEVIAERSLSTPAVLDLLDPDKVTPSVALLERVLAFKGGMPAGATQHLRRLVARIVARLAADLARRLRPALGALSIPRPARRGTRLDLPRTLRRNLDTAHRVDGDWRIVARSPVFRSRARRQMDWHLMLVVDVSGSMEASVIHSALCAAVFAALPALSLRFFAVSTAVVDLSEHAADPLDLLLEVSISGGTHLALGLQKVRQELRVPSRTMVVLVSDFEEGVSVGSLLGEVQALKATGAHLLGLAALDAEGLPRYHAGIAAQVAAAGMPVAALGPEHLARWVVERMR